TPVEEREPTSARPLDPHGLLFGRDDTPGIVSVAADRRGRARLWRRVDGRVVMDEDSYPNWLFIARRELLGNLPAVELSVSVLDARPVTPSEGVGLVKLRGENQFQYLVLTNRLDDVERQIADVVNRGNEDGSIPESYASLVYVRP